MHTLQDWDKLEITRLKKRHPAMASHNAIKAPHRYAVQGSDTTMMLIAASLPGQ